MKKFAASLICFFCLPVFSCCAQQTPQTIPDSPDPSTKPIPSANKAAGPVYSPPTQSDRFKTYLRHTYGITSILEAGIHGGIEQARDNPSKWPEGGQGYADRFGSAMGQIAVRGTTQYLVADLFKEDLRISRCHGCSLESRFKAAFEDTFTARKGEDGHRALSVARLVGPFSGSAVASNTWYPAGYGRSVTFKETGKTYLFVFGRNLVRELLVH